MELVSTNGGIQSICNKDETLPDPATVWKWMFAETLDVEDTVKPINAMYAQAKAQQMAKMSDDTLSISDDDSRDRDEVTGKYNMAAVQRDRLRTDTRKWLLSKLDRRTYGDKVAVETDNSSATSLTELMRQAQERAANGVNEQPAPPSASATGDSVSNSNGRTH